MHQPFSRKRPNISPIERALTGGIGGIVLASGLRGGRWRVARALLGSGMLARAVGGTCPVYTRAGMGTREQAPIAVSTTVARPADDVLALWGNGARMPGFFRAISAVEELNERRWRWTIDLPAGKSATFETDVDENPAAGTITWRTIALPFQGTLTLHVRPAPGSRGSELRLVAEIAQEHVFVTALGQQIGRLALQPLLADALARFKQLTETGQLATTEGQPSARDERQRTGDGGHAAQHHKKDEVQRASEESFPASDPPSWGAKPQGETI